MEKVEIKIIKIEGGFEIIGKFVNNVLVWTKKSPIRYMNDVKRFNK